MLPLRRLCGIIISQSAQGNNQMAADAQKAAVAGTEGAAVETTMPLAENPHQCQCQRSQRCMVCIGGASAMCWSLAALWSCRASARRLRAWCTPAIFPSKSETFFANWTAWARAYQSCCTLSMPELRLEVPTLVSICHVAVMCKGMRLPMP